MSLMSGKELAGELGVNAMTIWRAYRKGEIPGERIGRITRFDLERVRQAMRRRARMGPQPDSGSGARIGDSRPRTGTGSSRRTASSPPSASRARRKA